MLLDLRKKFVVLSGTTGITASTRQLIGIIRNGEDANHIDASRFPVDWSYAIKLFAPGVELAIASSDDSERTQFSHHADPSPAW